MDINLQAQSNEQEECAMETKIVEKYTQSDKRMIRSLVSTFVLLIAVFAIFAAQTYAFFNDSSNAGSNMIISGSVDMSLIDVNNNGSFDWTAQPLKIMPASVYTYGGVGVKNSGTLPIYVRIKVEKTLIQSESEISPGWEHLISCNFMANNDMLPEDQRDLWVYHEGYYYYRIALAPGAQTTSLFDKVLFAPEMGNEFQNSSIQFNVICQSVQASGNSPDPTTAWGWPNENGLSQ